MFTGVACRQTASEGALIIYQRPETEHSPLDVNDSQDLENPEDKFPKEKDKKLVA